MALTFTSINLNPAGGSTAPASRTNLASFKAALTSITLDASYATNGIPLTPQQLGMDSFVLGGVVTVRTAVATASPSNGVLDVTVSGTPTAPKLKLQAAGALAELAAGAGSGAVVDVLAFGA